MIRHKTNWAGQKFYRLTITKPTTLRDGRAVLWEAQCDCGITTFLRPKDAQRGKKKSCGCYFEETVRMAGRKFTPRISSARAVWKANYQKVKDKTCPFEIFLKLSQEKCYYCGRNPFRKYNLSQKIPDKTSDYQKEFGDFIYNGLDRIDSSKQHTEDNLVPCCYDCNKAKSSLTTEEFFTIISLIAKNHKLI